MEKSNIAKGQMFLHFDNSYMEKPRVWVKVTNRVLITNVEVSVFVDNDVLVKFALKNYQPNMLADKWNITDDYYGKMVREGKFVPLDDLRKADDICEQLGWPKYEIDLGF